MITGLERAVKAKDIRYNREAGGDCREAKIGFLQSFQKIVICTEMVGFLFGKQTVIT